MSRIVAALIPLTALPLLLPVPADAQIPFYTLPDDDFRWNWGLSGPEAERFGSPDIEVRGSESFFQCELTAKTRTLSMTMDEIRALEDEIRVALNFVYAVNEAMYYLDQSRRLDWAILDCEKYDAPPTSPEKSAEREAEAREKMLRELERRRARQDKGE